jgi:DNA replication protein DnaC
MDNHTQWILRDDEITRERRRIVEIHYQEKLARERAEMDERYKDLVDDKVVRVEKWMQNYWGVPPRYIHSTLDNYDGNEKIANMCRSSIDDGDILFTGSTGCGKTHLAIAMLKEIALRKIQPLREPGKAPVSTEPLTACFVTVTKLLLNLRASFNGGGRLFIDRHEREVSEQDIIYHYSHCDLLILDDLGAEKTSEFALSAIYTIIDERINYEKRTIVTTNLSLQEIEEKMDARLASRLSGMKIIKINMPDYRKKRG